MTLNYSKASLNDLDRTRSYISDTLKNRKAAEKLLKEIIQACEQLKTFPHLGRPLVDPNGSITNYRLLNIRNQIAVYEIIDDAVFVQRILDGRTDYLRLVFNTNEQFAF